MVFLVFTFANDLLRGIIEEGCLEYALYMIFWVALVIQTTFAYRHIMAIEEKDYTVKVLISDCIDIVVEIFVCAVIGSTYGANGYHELPNYKLLSIPFIVLAVNQIYWFSCVEKNDNYAITRLIILFVGMLAITISESICHSIWNLVAFVIIHALAMVILRAFDEMRKALEESNKQMGENNK